MDVGLYVCMYGNGEWRVENGYYMCGCVCVICLCYVTLCYVHTYITNKQTIIKKDTVR